MIKQTLLATVAAGMIAAGSTSAFAHGPGGYGPGGYGPGIQFGGPGWNVQIGNGFPHHPPQRVCKPIVKKVKWWDKFGYPHWNQVVVGQKCFFVKHNGPGPGYGPGFGGPGWGGPGFGGPGFGGPGPGWGGW